jgi:microcystin-dependent protein
MGQPYVGEIRIFAGNFPPNGWMFCEGQTLPISENDVLFQLIGTTYGGNGEDTFCLPDLRGRVPLHMGTSTASGVTYQIGEQAGTETETLTVQQIPSHTHPLTADTQPADNAHGNGRVLAETDEDLYVEEAVRDSTLHASSITPAGGSQPHENRQPYLCLHYIISLYGIFPSQT